jgi:putative addiction module component (TIGR02574 family)
MSPKAQKLYEAVLELPEQERVELVDAVNENLHGPAEEGVEEAWADEIKRRIEDVESGKVKTIPWEEVDRKLDRIIESHKRS